MKRPLIFSGDCDGDAEAQDFTVTKKLYLPDHEDHVNDDFRYSFDSFLWFALFLVDQPSSVWEKTKEKKKIT